MSSYESNTVEYWTERREWASARIPAHTDREILADLRAIVATSDAAIEAIKRRASGRAGRVRVADLPEALG